MVGDIEMEHAFAAGVARALDAVVVVVEVVVAMAVLVAVMAVVATFRM